MPSVSSGLGSSKNYRRNFQVVQANRYERRLGTIYSPVGRLRKVRYSGVQDMRKATESAIIQDDYESSISFGEESSFRARESSREEDFYT